MKPARQQSQPDVRAPSPATGTAASADLALAILTDTAEASDAPIGRLLQAVRAVGSALELSVVLRNTVEAAVTLVQAGHGTLGVLAADGVEVDELITAHCERPSSSHRARQVPHACPPDDLRQTPRRMRYAEPPPSSCLTVPVCNGDTLFGHLTLTGKCGGGELGDEDRQLLVAFAVAAGLAVRNARLYERTRQVSAWREAGRAVSTALLSGTEREDVIALLATTSRNVLAADTVVLALMTDKGMHVAASAGDPGPGRDAALLLALPPVLSEGLPRRVDSDGTCGFAVPLGPVGAACQGALVALWNSPPPALLVEDLQAFAAQAAVALELADHREQAENGAVLADRDRIGRDLHDVVIQRLFSAGMGLQSVIRLIPVDPVDATARIEVAVDDLDATIRQLRSAIYGLHVPLYDRPSLRRDLLAVVDAAAEDLGFVPGLRLDGLLDTLVAPELAEQALAVVREALTNTGRYACARRVEVSVTLGPRSLLVVVEDDVIGSTAGRSVVGLRALAGRVSELGGSLHLDAASLGGTRLTWDVPVDTTTRAPSSPSRRSHS